MKLQNVAGKRVMALFFSLCIVLSSFGTAFAATTDAGQTAKPIGNDIKGHWAETVLKQWVDKGLINGFKDGSLKPDNKITRAEFASFVNRANNFTEQASISFKDVSAKDWYYADVAKAKAAGYINGYSDQTFKPKQMITRLETAFIVAKLQKLEASNSADKLTDTDELSASSKSAIGAVIDAGIMSATYGKFRPQDSLSRAEAVTVIDRAVAKETFAVTYDKAGEYGSKSTPETVKGSVAITAPGVTLNNMVIEGDLLLAESIGEGEVFLKNVTVKGKTTINGGGKNSIHFEDSVLLTVIVNKKDGSIRIVAEGSTTVQQITLQSGARLEESQLTGSGFGDLVLSQAIPSGAQVDLSGRFETIDVIATSLRVNLNEGSIAALQVASSATNTNINIGTAANVASLILNAVTSVTGQGVITSATINASGSTIAQTPTNVTVGNGVNATVNGQTATTNTNTNNSGGSSSSGGGTSVSETVYGFSGTIVDADGVTVAGVQINFRSGIGNETGAVVATAITDADGKYSVSIRPGVYFGEVVKAGYLKTFVVGVSLSDGFNPGQDATIVKIPQDGEIRIVLSWGENPRDEDSHLLGPTPTGTSFHTAYYNTQYSVDGVVYADLDIDDTQSYGPETTTIRQRVNGKYQFYVHHFSGISTLQKSGAKVEVYVGAATAPSKTYTIPTGEGTEIYWDVFEMNINGADVTFTDRNVMTNTAPRSDYPVESFQPRVEDIFVENSYGATDSLTVNNLSVNDVVYYYANDNTLLGYKLADHVKRNVFVPSLDFGVNGTTIKIAVQSAGWPISSKVAVTVPSEIEYANQQVGVFDSSFTVPVTTSVNDAVYLQVRGNVGSQTTYTITNLEAVTALSATYLVLDSSNTKLNLVAFNTTDSFIEYNATVEISVGGHYTQTKVIKIFIAQVQDALRSSIARAEWVDAVPGTEATLAAQILAAQNTLDNPSATKQDYVDALTALLAVLKIAEPSNQIIE